MIQRARRSVKVLSTGTNFVIAGLCLVVSPAIILDEMFWQAPPWVLVIHFVCLWLLPLASIPFSVLRAERLERGGDVGSATRVRFLPALLLFVVGPIGLIVTNVFSRMVS